MHVLTGKVTEEQAMKAFINSEAMTLSWPDITTSIIPEAELENPKEAMQWRLIELPKKIVYYLTVCDQLYFGWIHGNPFTVPPLPHNFDWSATSVTLELVLDSDYRSDELNDLTQLFLHHCKSETNETQIGKQIVHVQWKTLRTFQSLSLSTF
eukprot:15367201-Ditylum_brightwellii.AAC.1